jgi:hypothetical protein
LFISTDESTRYTSSALEIAPPPDRFPPVALPRNEQASIVTSPKVFVRSAPPPWLSAVVLPLASVMPASDREPAENVA